MSSPKDRRSDLLKNILGVMVVIGALFLAFAPDSVWRGGGGVSPASERKPGADFALPDLKGNTWRLGEQRGKVVLVNYWATWCPPCREETPGLVRLANQYKEEGLEVVGVTLDEEPRLVPPFVDEYRISYTVLLPPDGSDLSQVAEALPTSLLYDRQGRLAKRYTGAISESVLRADIEQLLAEQ